MCDILFNGRLPQLPRCSVCIRVLESLAASFSKAKKFSSPSIYPVHPGNAKQVMEPATLWFERRARRVQTCDKRQTVGAPASCGWGIKGRRLYLVSVSKHLRIAYARSPGTLSRRALSQLLASNNAFGSSCWVEHVRRHVTGLCSKVHLAQIRCPARPSFHPAECFAGICSMRFRCRLCEEGWHRNRRTKSPTRSAAQDGSSPFRS